MRQLAYYLVVIVLGLGNLVLAAIAYRQRDKQIKGNALRETQVELAELRNEMAQRRMEYLGMQVQLLQEIRDALAVGGASTVAGASRFRPQAAGDRGSDERRAGRTR